MRRKFSHETHTVWTKTMRDMLIWLREEKGWTYAEIGRYFGISPLAAQSTFSRMRRGKPA